MVRAKVKNPKKLIRPSNMQPPKNPYATNFIIIRVCIHSWKRNPSLNWFHWGVCAWLILTIQVQTVWWDFLSILCLDYPVFWSKLLGSTLLPTSLHNKCFMSQAMWTWHFAWSARQGEDKNRASVTSPLFWLFPRSLHEHPLPIG